MILTGREFKMNKIELEKKYGKKIVKEAIKCYIGQNYTLEEIEDLCKKIIGRDWY